MSRVDFSAPAPLEKVEQQGGVNLLRSIGAKVYIIGTHRRKGDYQGTMQSPGLPDIFAFLPAPVFARVQFRQPGMLIPLWWEVKRAKGGKLSQEQERFQGSAQDCAALAYVVGPLDALIAFLVKGGWLKNEQLPHYRQVAL